MAPIPTHRAFLFLSLAALPLFAPRPRHQPDALPIVAHWRFQNGVKGTVAGPTHVLVDSSGNDQHGLAVGDPLFERIDLPQGNLALRFTSDAQRVFIPDDPVFELTEGLTLEACVRVDLYPLRLAYIVGRGDDRPGFESWFLGMQESGQLVFVVSDACNQGSAVSSPRPLPIGTVLHVAGTLDHRTGLQRLFVNGECVATQETGIRALGPLGGPNPGIGIGNVCRNGDQGFRGAIAEVRITAAALATEQMLPATRAQHPR